jgi:hypothetical protein
MSDAAELAAFKAELQAAGEPWSRRGVRTIMAGFIGCFITLVVTQYIAALFVIRLPLFVASLTVLAIGWVFMIMGMVKRAQWAKQQALHVPPLSADPLSDPDAPGAR